MDTFQKKSKQPKSVWKRRNITKQMMANQSRIKFHVTPVRVFIINNKTAAKTMLTNPFKRQNMCLEGKITNTGKDRNKKEASFAISEHVN